MQIPTCAACKDGSFKTFFSAILLICRDGLHAAEKTTRRKRKTRINKRCWIGIGIGNSGFGKIKHNKTLRSKFPLRGTGALPLLRSQPSFRNFIAACEEIIFIRTCNEFFIRHLHPPPSCFFALQESCGHLSKCCVKFIE
jgi:hypothetical protein